MPTVNRFLFKFSIGFLLLLSFSAPYAVCAADSPEPLKQFYAIVNESPTSKPLTAYEISQLKGYDPQTTLVAEVGSSNWIYASNLADFQNIQPHDPDAPRKQYSQVPVNPSQTTSVRKNPSVPKSRAGTAKQPNTKDMLAIVGLFSGILGVGILFLFIVGFIVLLVVSVVQAIFVLIFSARCGFPLSFGRSYLASLIFGICYTLLSFGAMFLFGMIGINSAIFLFLFASVLPWVISLIPVAMYLKVTFFDVLKLWSIITLVQLIIGLVLGLFVFIVAMVRAG